MKRFIIPSLLLFAIVSGCHSGEEHPTSESDIDAARNFIQAALYGKYDEARIYMLKDSASEDKMKLIERIHITPKDKQGLATASINIHNVRKINDSTTIIVYSNSYKNRRDSLKVVKVNDQWLVDFNYMFNHDSDPMNPSYVPDNHTDSIP